MVEVDEGMLCDTVGRQTSEVFSGWLGIEVEW